MKNINRNPVSSITIEKELITLVVNNGKEESCITITKEGMTCIQISD